MEEVDGLTAHIACGRVPASWSFLMGAQLSRVGKSLVFGALLGAVTAGYTSHAHGMYGHRRREDTRLVHERRRFFSKNCGFTRSQH